MRQRRTFIPTNMARSTYSSFFQSPDHPRTKGALASCINREIEHRDHHPRPVNPEHAEQTNYTKTFDPKNAKLESLREILDDKKANRVILEKYQKIHVDLDLTAPLPRSTYKAGYAPIRVPGKIIYTAPKYPLYKLPLHAQTESKHASQHVMESLKHYQEEDLVVTEPPRKTLKVTSPFGPKGRAEFTTENRSRDSFLVDKLYNSSLDERRLTR